MPGHRRAPRPLRPHRGAGRAVRPKPYPDVYLTAARLCGVAPGDALAVEDSHCGVQSAARAGLRILGVGPCAGEETAAMVDLWVTTLDEPQVFEWARDRVSRHLSV